MFFSGWISNPGGRYDRRGLADSRRRRALRVASLCHRQHEAFDARDRDDAAICDTHLKGRHDLEVIDLYLNPEAAAREQIIAAPTLVKLLPAPLRRIIGDLSDQPRVLAGLGLSIPKAVAS
jgi:hypothetical protein